MKRGGFVKGNSMEAPNKSQNFPTHFSPDRSITGYFRALEIAIAGKFPAANFPRADISAFCPVCHAAPCDLFCIPREI